MGYEVRISDEALGDLDLVTGFLKLQGGDEVAGAWLSGIVEAMGTLARHSERCAVAQEAGDVGEAVRMLLFGRRNRAYKIYYRVRVADSGGGTVPILHVRHWARRPLSGAEMAGLAEEERDD